MCYYKEGKLNLCSSFHKTQEHEPQETQNKL